MSRGIEIDLREMLDEPSSLNKIFKQYFNISPTEYRTNKNITITKHVIKNFNIKLEPPRILEIPDMEVIYINITGEYGNKNYQKAWMELENFVKKNKRRKICCIQL